MTAELAVEVGALAVALSWADALPMSLVAGGVALLFGTGLLGLRRWGRRRGRQGRSTEVREAGARSAPNPAPAVQVGLGHAQSVPEGRERLDAFGFFRSVEPGPGGPEVVAVVADGVAVGVEGSRSASLAVRTFLDKVREPFLDGAPGSGAAERLAVADRVAHATLLASAGEAGAGAAPAAAFAAVSAGPGGLRWVAAGDVRIYLCRSGSIHQVNLDHTFARVLARAVSRGQMSPAEAESRRQRSALTSYLGTAEALELDASLRPYPLCPGDRIILCTGALWRRLAPPEILRWAGPPEVASSPRLLEAILELEAPSRDVTVLDLSLTPVVRGHPSTAPTNVAEAP